MQLLRRGDCGPAVREIRTTLGQLGLLPAVPPGSRAQDMFDDGVDRAVRMFQQGRGLITDGIVGPDTARALREAGWSLGDRMLSFTLSTPTTGDDVAHLLTDAAVGLVVARPEHEELLAPYATVVGPDWLAGQETEDPPALTPTPDTVVNVQYTSGTTGRPKGCLLDHTYWTTLGGSMLTEHPHLGPDDVLLTAQPFHYVDPQWNVVAALMAGAHLVVLDGFHPSTFWAKVREHGVTYFYCLASMPVLLLRMPPDPADRDHRVRAVQCSAIPPALHAELEERWGVPWAEAFGMTETGADIRVGADEHDELVGSGCLGRPAAHREARIDDAGQLWLRGRGMMQGYLGHPSPFDAEGWFGTGDVSTVGEDGRLVIRDRSKDLVKSGGEWISSIDLENHATAHPDIASCAVIAVPHPKWDERPLLIVQPAPGEKPSKEEVLQQLEGKIAKWWTPDDVQFVEEIPLGATGKINKLKLREMFKDYKLPTA